jgi:hypothetical protein
MDKKKAKKKRKPPIHNLKSLTSVFQGIGYKQWISLTCFNRDNLKNALYVKRLRD